MNTIRKEQLSANPDLGNAFQTTININGQIIDISIEPDDVELEKTIDLANKILGKLEIYEPRARKIIIEMYLENYNQNWRDEEANEPELDEKSFNENLTLTSIAFLSDSSIDFFYTENGMFGNHSLIAQAFDGENFEDAIMYG